MQPRHRLRSIPTLLTGPTLNLAPAPPAHSFSRSYAIASGQPASNAARDARDSTSADSKLDVIRRVLYPPTPTTSAAPSAPAGSGLKTALLDSTRQNPSTPTGTYSQSLVPKLQHVLGPTPEIHQTIMRAWDAHTDRQARLRELSLRKKYASMHRACEALRLLGEEDKGVKKLYEAAMFKPNMRKVPRFEAPADGRKISLVERKWREARIEGLFPREMEVPRETWKSGERWAYDWKKVI